MSSTQISIGDTLRVALATPREGGGSASKRFEGVVVARRRSRSGVSFTLRRGSAREGVELTWALGAPGVLAVEVLRRAKVRRAKLYFLRERAGKAARLPTRPAAPSKRRGRKRGAKAKAERRAQRERDQGPPPPPLGGAGVFARLRPTDPPRVPPRPRGARRGS